MVIHPQVAKHWLVVGWATSVALCLAAAAVLSMLMREKPSPAELEERRRRMLADAGRIVDGSLVDAETVESVPQVIIYSYRIAGVTYRCAQDVTKLPNLVGNLRLDYPVQVRYNRENPADSIVVSETWNGLWTNIWHPTPKNEAARRTR
jgi:hypothetical protein